MQAPEPAHYDTTTLHPIGVAALVGLGAATLVLPRRLAAVPAIVLACFVPSAQRVVLAGLDFTFLRVFVLIGLARLALRGEWRGLRWQAMDVVLVAYVAAQAFAYVALRGSLDAAEYASGRAFDALGLYFLFRQLVQRWIDIDRIALALAWIAVPVAGAFLYEHATGRNLFSIFGGVAEYTQVRNGKLRCQGAFAHPIMAGVFWASLVPLVAARWWSRPWGRTSAVVGVAASFLIVWLTASSTPLLGLMLGVAAAFAFPLRSWLRPLRWIAAFGLVALHLTMNKPVWHLIARIDLVGGSTGWHRYFLIDRTIANFGEWALVGVEDTSHWGRGLGDVTNQYVLEAVRGGLLALVLFVAVLALAFGRAGRLVRWWRGSPAVVATSWALGVALFVHAAQFLAVSYFGQTILSWYLVLACVASLAARTELLLRTERRRARARAAPAPAFAGGALR